MITEDRPVYRIKKPKHVLNMLSVSKTFCVHAYKPAHSRARKICNKMQKDGTITMTRSGDLFWISCNL